MPLALRSLPGSRSIRQPWFQTFPSLLHPKPPQALLGADVLEDGSTCLKALNPFCQKIPPCLENTPASFSSQKMSPPFFFLQPSPSLFPPETGTLRHPILASAVASPSCPGHTVQRAPKDQGTQRTRCFKWALQERERASAQPIISKARPTTADLRSLRLLRIPQQPEEGSLSRPFRCQEFSPDRATVSRYAAQPSANCFPQKKSSLTA